MTITYLSRPAPDVTLRDVQDIWIQCLENNEPMEVTGVLYYGGDLFFQVIEGEEGVIERLFRKIKKDPRHQDVELLAMNDLATAMFHETPMRLIDGSQSKHLQDLFNYDQLLGGGPKAANRAAFKLRKL